MDSCVCSKEIVIDEVEKNIVRLEENVIYINSSIKDVKATQKTIIGLLIGGLVSLTIEMIGLLITIMSK